MLLNRGSKKYMKDRRENTYVFLAIVTQANRVSSCEAISARVCTRGSLKKNMHVYDTGNERPNEFLFEMVKKPRCWESTQIVSRIKRIWSVLPPIADPVLPSR